MVLRSAGYRLLWMCMRPGAKAKDFISMWDKAPACDFGITIYSGNDFISKDQVSESEIHEHLQSMVSASVSKCGTPFFICNDPQFYPRLDQGESGFGGRMLNAIRFIESCTNRPVWQCSAYIPRVKLRDALHFAPENVDVVVRMYVDDFFANRGLRVDDYMPDMKSLHNFSSKIPKDLSVSDQDTPKNSSDASNSGSAHDAAANEVVARALRTLHAKYAGLSIDLKSSGVRHFEKAVVCEIENPSSTVCPSSMVRWWRDRKSVV